MSDRFDSFAPGGLEAAIGDLAGQMAFPTASPDFAARVTARIVAASAADAAPAPWWRRAFLGAAPAGVPLRRPVRRALLVAIALVLLVAAVAGALGLGLPGIRLILGPAPVPTPTATVPPTVRPSGPAASPAASLAPGATLGLGQPVAVTDVAARAAFPIRFPTDPLVGAPAAAYIDGTKAGQVSLVWRTRPDLPPTLDPGVGLLLGQFNGRLDEGFITKSIDTGTRVERVRVSGNDAFWISGNPHFFFYQGPDGQVVQDGRRWVGDTLLWSDGATTYRLETALGRDAAIRIAESLR